MRTNDFTRVSRPALFAAFFCLLHSPVQAVVLDVQEIASTSGSLSATIYSTSTAADPGALYLVEQYLSRVRRFDLQTGAVSTILDLPNYSAAEQGLKGMAFHPDYATNGKFYVHHFDGTNVNILEFTRDFELPTVDVSTQKTILSFSHINTSGTHTAGWIGFSPVDNYLYIPTGDGGSGGCAQCGRPAQDLNDLRGKVLRIDINSDQFPENETRNYAIPEDNPFTGVDQRPEIFAYGLRHPWRAGFDSLTGDLYIGDVGSQYFEEINLIPAGSGGGQNFGWRAVEGTVDVANFPDPRPENAVDPLYAYANGAGAAIVVGPVYRGEEIPGLWGNLVFADFVRMDAFTLDPTGGVAGNFTDRTAEIGGYAQVAAIAEDAQGELYLISRSYNSVFKIVGITSADFNRDGVVDGDDLLQWQDDYGINGDSDADGDSDSDGRDFLAWQRAFNDSLPEVSQAVVMPEPTGFVLHACVAALCAIRR